MQNVIQWYVDQMLSKFNDIEEIVLIQKEWDFVWAPFITLIGHRRDKIVQFKYHYGRSFPLEWWIRFLFTNAMPENTQPQTQRLQLNTNHNLTNNDENSLKWYKQSNCNLPKLRVFVHRCCFDFIRFAKPFVLNDSFVHSISGLKQLILINGAVVIDKTFWISVAKICSIDREFWSQLELLKINSHCADNLISIHHDDSSEDVYDQAMSNKICAISGNLINLKEIDIMSNNYVLYLLLFRVMARCVHNINPKDIYNNNNYNSSYSLEKVCISGCENTLHLTKSTLRFLMRTVRDWLHKDKFNFNCKDLSIDIWLVCCYRYSYNVGINDFFGPYDQGYKLWKKILTCKFSNVINNHKKTDHGFDTNNNNNNNNNNIIYCNLERLFLMWDRGNSQLSQNYFYQPLKLLTNNGVIFTRLQMLEISLSYKINAVKIIEMMQIIRNKVEQEQQQGIIDTIAIHLFMRVYLYDARLTLQTDDIDKITNIDDNHVYDGIDYGPERRRFSKLLDIVGGWFKFGLTDCFVIFPGCTPSNYSTTSITVQQRLVQLYKDVVSKHWLSSYCTIYGNKVEREELHRKLKPLVEERCNQNNYCYVSPGFDTNKTVSITINSDAALTLFIQNVV